MRTTITLEPDVAARLKELAHRQRTTFKDAVNTVLRRGLSAQEARGGRAAKFVVTPNKSGFRPGVDPGKLNQLLDQLDADAFASPRR